MSVYECRGTTVISADETGLVKGVGVTDSKVKFSYGVQDFSRNIKKMCWSGPFGGTVDSRQNQVAYSMANGQVEFLNLCSGEVVSTFDGFDDIVGLEIIPSQQSPDGRALLTCTSAGQIRLSDLKFRSESGTTRGQPLQVEVGAGARIMRVDSVNARRCAVAGNELELAVWDLPKKKAVFVGRNVRDHFLSLHYPVKISDLRYFPNDSSRIATCTDQLLNESAHVRIYDCKATNKRPVLDVKAGEHSLSCLAISSDSRYIFTGDTRGFLQKLDIRTGRQLSRLRGFEGSIKSVECHSSLPLVAAGGLGRHLVVSNYENNKQIAKVYLKQKISAVLFCDSVDQSKNDAGENDDVWEELDNKLGDSSTKRARDESNESESHDDGSKRQCLNE
eukprot:2838_1